VRIRGGVPAPIAAQQAGVSREVLLRACMRREIEARQIAGRWLLNPASLKRFIAARQSRLSDGPADPQD